LTHLEHAVQRRHHQRALLGAQAGVVPDIAPDAPPAPVAKPPPLLALRRGTGAAACAIGASAGLRWCRVRVLVVVVVRVVLKRPVEPAAELGTRWREVERVL